MLLDANILLYAVDESSPRHAAARAWLSGQLNGSRRIGLPWASLLAFLRISTHARVFDQPLRPNEAWEVITAWTSRDVVWFPAPGPHHSDILGKLVLDAQVSGNLVPDAHLAALAIEHGLVLHSADTDFARFPGVRWENPF